MPLKGFIIFGIFMTSSCSSPSLLTKKFTCCVALGTHIVWMSHACIHLKIKWCYILYVWCVHVKLDWVPIECMFVQILSFVNNCWKCTMSFATLLNIQYSASMVERDDWLKLTTPIDGNNSKLVKYPIILHIIHVCNLHQWR
jgi:hypothetical protein